MKIDLTEKVALVTGASRGIGRCIALAFAGAGAAVVVNYRDNEALAGQVVQEIKGAGAEALSWRADVGDADQAKAMVEGVVSHFGHLDILVSLVRLVYLVYLVWLFDLVCLVTLVFLICLCAVNCLLLAYYNLLRTVQNLLLTADC